MRADLSHIGSAMTSPFFTRRTGRHCGTQIPAKHASGRSSARANHTGGCVPSGNALFSEKLVNGTTQRCSMSSQRRQCGDDADQPTGVGVRAMEPGSPHIVLRRGECKGGATART